MKPVRILLATAALLMAAPAVASAHGSHFRAVESDVQRAEHALARVRGFARHHPAAALHALAIARLDTRAAAILTGTDYQQSPTGAVGELELVGQLLGSEASTFSGLVPVTSGTLQGVLASGVPPAVVGAGSVISFLQSLLPSLTATGQSGVTTQIEQLLSSLRAELATLANQVKSGNLPQTVQGVVSQALQTVTAALNAVLSKVQTVISSLPPSVQQPLQQVLAVVTGAVGQVTQTLQQQLPQLLQAVSQLGLGNLLGGLFTHI
jgi:hypothetical protein